MVPSTTELCELMKAEDPTVDLSDAADELVNLGVSDTWDIYSLPVEILATFGSLGHDGARRLQAYCKDKILDPLELTKVEDRPDTHEDDDSDELVLRWLDDVHAYKVCEEMEEIKSDVIDSELARTDDNIEEDSGSDGGSDVATATSYVTQQEV